MSYCTEELYEEPKQQPAVMVIYLYSIKGKRKMPPSLDGKSLISEILKA
jgi:hypothetical protein